MRTRMAGLGSSLQLFLRLSFLPSPGFSYPWNTNGKLILGAELCTLQLCLHIPVQLCSGGTSGNVSKELEKIPRVLFSWLCKSISAYQATQRNAKIFTRSSCGLSFEF